jgi:hypothetical protein
LSWNIYGKENKMQPKPRQLALTILMAAALLSLASIVVAVTSEATALTGTVVSVNRDLNFITVRDDVTGRTFKIDTRAMNGKRSIDVWSLRAGDRISATGAWANSETYRADRVMFANRQALNRLANGVTGTVEEVNRDLNYITIRDDATGQNVKVDVRKMDTRRSVNVWQLRNGDVVTAYGKWAKKRGTLRADFVNFGSTTPMTSGLSSPNVLSGTVDTVNRDLNYFTLRDDATGQTVKIDVRQMDARRSVNVWNLRAGDHITVDGSWTPGRDLFQAEMVRF